jgi:hypothetical protein
MRSAQETCFVKQPRLANVSGRRVARRASRHYTLLQG